MHALYEEYDLASFWTVRTFCTENALTLLYTKENKCNQTTWWVSTIAAARGRGIVGHPPVRIQSCSLREVQAADGGVAEGAEE